MVASLALKLLEIAITVCLYDLPRPSGYWKHVMVAFHSQKTINASTRLKSTNISSLISLSFYFRFNQVLKNKSSY